MKSKIFASLIFGVLALVLLTSAASAAVDFLDSSNAAITSLSATVEEGQSVTLSFKAQEDNTENWTAITFNTPVTMTLGTGTFNSSNTITNVITTLAQDATSGLMSLTFTVPYDTVAGVYTGNLILSGTGDVGGADTFTLPLTITVTEAEQFCNSGDGSVNDSDLELKVDLNNEGEGKDTEWLALDTITVKVKFENNKNDNDDENDLEDVVFKLGLYNEDGEDIAEDLQWISKDAEEVEVGDVDAGDDFTHTFEFKVDPSEMDLGEDYVLMVKAYTDGEESATCVDYSSDWSSSKYYQTIKVEKETDSEKMVVVDVDALPQPIEALCGQEVTITADVYNLGTDDFPDQIKVTLVNTELGLNLEEVVSGDLDAGDKTTVTFTFRVPANAEEKVYTLNARTYYDYDEDDEEYDEVSEDEFPLLLKVTGGCVFEPKLTISADLTSGGKAGEDMVVKATVTNTDSKTRTFAVDASGLDSWAKLASVSSETLTLAAGESKEVTFTLSVNADVEGKKEFSIDLTTADGKVIPQPVEVLVEKSGFSLTGAFGGANKNWYIWGIGALNIVLILIIILVAVRLVKK